jgi:alpha-1,3-rhamnosyltransferase
MSLTFVECNLLLYSFGVDKMSEITVLVPSYNHAPFVERTLRSIFAQTLQPRRLIVIDDGSKDESVQIIQTVMRDCPFENDFIVRENRGLCATLNEGFAKSSGDYFAYLGSDDVWLPDFLSESIKLLETRPKAVLSFGHAYLIDENDQIIDCTNNWTEFADGDVLPFLLRGLVFASPSVIYRRSSLEKYSWNETAKLEDYELYLRLASEGEFARNDKLLCAWRQHDSNASDNFPLMLQEWLAAQDRVAKKLNISREDLNRIQTELKFNAVFDFIRSGNRRGAISLMFKNYRGAKSAKQFAKMLVRLAVPQTLFQWNRNRKRLESIKKFGMLRF